MTLPFDELEDELFEGDFAPLDLEPPEFDPDDLLPELGRLTPAFPLPLDPDERVAVDFPVLLDPDRVVVVPEPELDRVEGLVTPAELRPEVEEPDFVADCPEESLLLPEVKDPRVLHESPEGSPDRVADSVRVALSFPERSVALIRAPPMVVMTRCAGSVDPAFPRRQSSFAAFVSLFDGALLTG